MAEKKPINWQNVLTVYGAAILVGTELIGMTWAGAWALGGIFDLPIIFRRAIELFGVILGAYGVYHFLRAALRVEPIRG